MSFNLVYTRDYQDINRSTTIQFQTEYVRMDSFFYTNRCTWRLFSSAVLRNSVHQQLNTRATRFVIKFTILSIYKPLTTPCSMYVLYAHKSAPVCWKKAVHTNIFCLDYFSSCRSIYIFEISCLEGVAIGNLYTYFVSRSYKTV